MHQEGKTTGPNCVLIVDDDETIRAQMKWALTDDFEIHLADDRESAIKICRENEPVVVCLDLGLPPEPAGVNEGFRALGEILKLLPYTKIVVITGQGEKENAMKAIRKGAYDFFPKPIDVEVLKVVLQRAVHLRTLEEENRELTAAIKTDSFEGMIGTSDAIQEVFTTLRKVANTDAPVLISGESGTGKELAAKAIHSLSKRNKGPFVPINCGAIPENLLESELFGHEKGSFTGAHAQRQGQVEMAIEGTLFLDEIGELPHQLQVKLLRFLQDGIIQRVGGRKTIEVDTRIVAATNAHLEDLIKENRFREDLYYRIAIIGVELPPLRERDEDILLLAKYFLNRFSNEFRKRITGFDSDAMELILNYTWPGNIREMENRIRRSVIMSEGNRVSRDELGLDSSFNRFFGLTLKTARESVEREMINRALLKNKGNVSKAASELDISRPTLYELMDKLDISRP
jgi:two-component system NtrC family response regulator